MRESDMLMDRNGFYVMRQRSAYVVFRPSPSGMYAISDSAYALTDDGLSIAKARCDYLARRAAK